MGIVPTEPAEVLRVNQLQAISALMAGKSNVQAAKDAGVHTRTLQLWLRDDADFVKEYKHQAEEIRLHAVAKVKATTTAAVDVVARGLKSRSEGRRLAAARIIINAAAAFLKAADEAGTAMVPLFALPPGTQVGFSIPAPADILEPPITIDCLPSSPHPPEAEPVDPSAPLSSPPSLVKAG